MKPETFYKKAKKDYNDLMNGLGYEFITIDTDYTEERERKAQWTVRDMVSEAQYQMDMYFEYGMEQNRQYNADEDEYDDWQSIRQAAREAVRKLRTFINKYKGYINGMKCFEGHSSKYDN